MTKPLNNEQVERVARRMGYSGPMSKFGEFLMSSPKGYAEGGVVIPVAPTGNKNTTTTTTVTGVPPTPTEQSFNTTQFTPPQVDVAKVKTESNQFIPQGSGQLTDPLVVDPTELATQTVAMTPEQIAASQAGYTAAATPEQINTATAGQQVANAPDVTTANTYNAVLTQPGLDNLTDSFKFATGQVDQNSTVQGQMSDLMGDFENGTPAWAAGAMRASDAQSLARGMGSSSMAAAATTQAAMEAALPIAMQDANAYLQMQFLNLNNEQQALMLANQTRTQALFTDAAAQNAALQFNATSKTQTDQFNASLKSSVDTFNAAQANALAQFNAAALNQSNLTQAQLTSDTNMFNAGQLNTISQFNAAQQNEIATINAQMLAETSMFNAGQANATSQFNSGQKNAMTQFKATMENDRQKFNASNQLIIDQANAQWRQEVATVNNANINEANRLEAQMKMDKTLTEMNAYFQERRDTLQYAYQAGQNDADRATQLLMAQMSLDETARQADQASSDSMWAAVGAVTAEFVDGWIS